MKNIRFVTAASLFDGHDVSINIMRRMLQSKGVEVIHLGHNRSAKDVVDCALQEDVHAIAISSYQGGHMEYFKYIYDLLGENNARHIKIFGGGGGVITPQEIKELHAYGIDRIYHPEDGASLGLEGIIDDMIARSSYDILETFKVEKNKPKNSLTYPEISKLISYIENKAEVHPDFKDCLKDSGAPVLGITGTGGAGKSSLIDELLIRFQEFFSEKKIALLSIDPTKKKTQGALLGDRIRITTLNSKQVFVRSLATRNSMTELSPQIQKVVPLLRGFDFDLIIVETSGIGQAQDAIREVADYCAYVMTAEYGAQTQLEKIEMLEVADFIVLNKFEKARSEDALRDIRKQFRRNHQKFDLDKFPDQDLPIYATQASRFNNEGVNALFKDLIDTFKWENSKLNQLKAEKVSQLRKPLISDDRVNYLAQIAKVIREYNKQTFEYADIVKKLEALDVFEKNYEKKSDLNFEQEKKSLLDKLPEGLWEEVLELDSIEAQKFTSLSGSQLSKVAMPPQKYFSKSALIHFVRNQNIPGRFPFAHGLFPYKRADEDPKRMFAGEGGPERTNERFHFLSKDDKAKRLSTAFDSVTLYGEDPATEPDIFGKIGESGVSIATVEDMDLLYKGFDLTSPYTSVSMTINGPAPIILAMFMTTACRQKHGVNYTKEQLIEVMREVRGTVQADILKEDQAQNTCIFSLEFALKMMGDIQEFFCQNQVKNYYAVSISGYHIAEAGANPITQLALTLSNGLTYVEYYLSRGMKIDDFAQNLSFFFSNGLDPEYTVIGRVARVIWAKIMKYRYGANLKSQRLKYHIQTSGRSLHAQEIDFNDIRTTLQAFLALSDNCNSLHTNAYDEAITTPTKESVRRAMAIQMIINKEFGLNKCDNPLQGSFFVEELCEIVEEATLEEFERISRKGGVLGAMESMYQRSKIQDESIYYEHLKDKGDLPIVGVNTYINPDKDENEFEIELTRASVDEKNDRIKTVNEFKEKHKTKAEHSLNRLKEVALNGENIFEELLECVKFCSLGQITETLYSIGGRYRRNM